MDNLLVCFSSSTTGRELPLSLLLPSSLSSSVLCLLITLTAAARVNRSWRQLELSDLVMHSLQLLPLDGHVRIRAAQSFSLPWVAENLFLESIWWFTMILSWNPYLTTWSSLVWTPWPWPRPWKSILSQYLATGSFGAGRGADRSWFFLPGLAGNSAYLSLRLKVLTVPPSPSHALKTGVAKTLLFQPLLYL